LNADRAPQLKASVISLRETSIALVMKEVAPILFLLFLFSAGSWLLVFKKSARHKVQKGAWRLYGLERQEQKETYDAAYLAGMLVLALVFTVLFFVALVASIVKVS
jgi:ABC-type phosphate transport system permease subunit